MLGWIHRNPFLDRIEKVACGNDRTPDEGLRNPIWCSNSFWLVSYKSARFRPCQGMWLERPNRINRYYSRETIFLTFLKLLKNPANNSPWVMKRCTRMVELVFEQMIVSLQFVLSRFGIKLFVDELSRIVCVLYYQMSSYVVCLVSPRYIGTLTYKYILFAGFFDLLRWPL